MFRKRFGALLSGLLLLAPVCGWTAPLRLVTGADYPPFADPLLPSGGLVTALVLAAFAAADVPAEAPLFEPWRRGYQDVLDGSDDATFPYVHTPRREREMLFSDPIYDIVSVALFRAGSGRDYTGPDSLRGSTLCLPIGFASAPPIAELIEAGAVQVEQPTTTDHCLRELAAGRVDVFVSAADLLDQRIAILFGDSSPFVRAALPVYRQSLHLVAARGNPNAADLIRRFNAGLADLRGDGRYDEIVRRQLGAS
jgi:polar amino acid transport system substrate-binding protein